MNEASLPEKKDFYSSLIMRNNTDADSSHAKRVCKDFEIKNLGIRHGLYVRINMLWLTDAFEIDRAHFLFTPGLVWQATLNKIKVKLDFLTDIDILLTVEKGIRGGICHSIY